MRETPQPATERARVDITEARKMIGRIAEALWSGRTSGHLWTIPADVRRDWDCMFSDALDELEALRARSAPVAPLPGSEREMALREMEDKWRVEATAAMSHPSLSFTERRAVRHTLVACADELAALLAVPR